MGCTGSYIAAFVLGIEHVGYKVTIEIGMFSSFSIYSFLVRYKWQEGWACSNFFLDLEHILYNMNAFLILKVLVKNFCSVSVPYKSFYAFIFLPNDGIVLDRSVCSCERTIVPQERGPALVTTHFFHIKKSLLKSIVYSENNNFFKIFVCSVILGPFLWHPFLFVIKTKVILNFFENLKS